MKRLHNTMPAVAALAGWAAGIVLWRYGAGWAIAAAAAAMGCVFALRRYYSAMAVAYALAAGWIVAWTSQPAPAPDALLDGREMRYVATVRSVRNTPGALTMVLDVDSVAGQRCRRFGVQIASVPEWMPPAVGDIVSFNATLYRPEQPGSYPYAPDYSNMYLANGVVATAYIDDEYKIIGHMGGFRAAMAARRDAVVSMLARSGLSDTAYVMLAAVIAGYTDDLDPAVREGFSTVGIAHALALSGFHVGVVVLIVSLVLFPLRLWPLLRPWRIAAGVLVVWLYAFMVGLPDSVLRAVLMLSVYSLALIIGRKANPYNTLSVAIIIILALRPYSLFSAGLQLSVCAVLGILAFAGKFNPVDPRRHLAHTVIAPVAVACAALLGTMPVTLVVFHRLPLLFMVSNVLIAIALPVMMCGGILLIVCSWLGIGTGLLCIMLNNVSGWLDAAVGFMASLPFAAADSVYLSSVQIGLLVLAIIMLAVALHIHRRWCVGAAAAATILFITSSLWAGEEIAREQAFLLPLRGNTALVVRDGNKAVATVTCHERHAGNACANIERALTHYMAVCRVDTLQMATGDFSLGKYRRSGDMFEAAGVRVALLVRPGRPDSLAESPCYAIVGNRCRLSGSDIIRLIHPDTLVLGYDLSARRRHELLGAGIPIIDLQDITQR